jgi:predicted CXXCH cytochrome family protein
LAISISKRIEVAQAAILLALLGSIIIIACNTHATEKVKDSPFLNVYGEADYVGSVTCENCHADKQHTFQHTGMGLSFSKATRQKSGADFSNALIYDSFSDLFYRSFWRGENMFIAEFRIQEQDTTHYREEKIEYIIGSGQHTNSHFWSDEGYIYQAPMTWYVQEQKWGLPPGYESNNIRFSRKIEQECMTCHNSLPIMDKASTHKYLDIPNGISCERCHGPGSIHVKEKNKGITVDVSKGADYTIVNPKRLPWKLQIDLCQRCHLQGNAVLKSGKSFADFRPGMALSEVMQVYLPKYDNDNHPFIMASHAERFQQSKCFIQSNSDNLSQYNPELNFTCISCHNPHISVKETNIGQFNSTCVGCHAEGKNASCSESDKMRMKVGDNCVNCHMPLKGAKDIPHVSIHDHYIRKPGKDSVVLIPGKVVGLKSINGGEKTNEMQLLAYLTYFEKFDAKEFYMDKADDLAAGFDLINYSPAVVHYWYNKQKFNEVKRIGDKIDTLTVAAHFTAYQIAQSYSNELSYTSALLWYQRAISLKSKHMEYRLARVEALLKLNQPKKALLDVNYIMTEQKKNAQAYYYYGLILVSENKPTLAMEQFKQVLRLEPDHKQAKKQLNLLNAQ